jgi:flagellar hook-associated protein FlgK
MSLALSLNNALTGLRINQQSLAVLSQNIANANTQGYSRKVLTQQAIYLDGHGSGVSMQDVTRKVDEYLLKSIRLQSATVGRAETMSDYMERSQLLIGNPGAGNSIDAYITSFFNAVQTLAQSPENTTLRVNMLNTAKNLAQQSRQLAQGLQDLRLQADQDITRAISAINKDIEDLQLLNRAISQDAALGKPVAELLDKRDIVLRDISQYMDISTYTRADGTVNVFTAGGVSLLDESAYKLSYSAVTSPSTLINDTALAPILIYRLDDNGNTIGNPTTLATGGSSAQVSSILTSGKLKGLLDLRDRQVPAMLAQLDVLTANMRGEFNRIHNNGIAFPGANSYTGTRAVFAQDFSQWAGQTRFAVLGPDGQPIASPYPGETSGVRPLLMDLANLDTGQGRGNPSVQGIIDEFNQYYGAPRNKAVVGNLNNIRLASGVTSLPGSPPHFDFDFDLENISATNASFFVTNIQVLDDTNTDITSITQNVPQIDLAAVGTYTTTSGSTTVTANTTLPPGVSVGDRIYLSTPSGPVDGIPASELGGFVTVTAVNGNSFDFTVTTPAGAGGSFNEANQTMTPPYAEVAAGEYGRTTDDGVISADLSGNSSSSYYTVLVDVAVDDGEGNLTISQVSYRVDNSQSNLLNNRYSVNNVTGGGTMVMPTTNQPLARAMLVDANGVELPRINGQYTTAQQGFLKIVAGNSSNVIAIDSLNSEEQGQPNGSPPVDATGRGFSYFFELNNFFTRLSSEDGDEITGSALNLAIEERLLNNPNLISLGRLVQSVAQTGQDPLYTYERHIGDNHVIQQLAALSNSMISFAAAGGLGATTQTFNGYAGIFIGSASSNASLARSDQENAETLMNGYTQRSDAISGVNLDEELANTIIYQNAYSASARVITVTNDLYNVLLNSFQ